MREQKKSQAEINAQIGEYNAKWQAMADTYGWSAQQLEQIKKTVGYIGEMESPVIKIDADASNAVDQVHQFLSFVKENKDGQITINANDDPAMEALAVALNAVRQADGTFTINANDDPAMAELLAYTSEVNMSDGTVKLLANSDNADKKLTDVISDINSSEGILAILGNKDPTTVTLGEVVAEINARRDAMLQIQGDNKHALAAVNAVVQYARNNPATQILDIFTNKHETTFTRKVNLDGNDIPVASKNKRTYWTGGYTGPGNMYHPAGIVHAGEYVVPKRVVDRTGPRYWDELVASMPGYASGGFVSQIASTPPPPQPLIALDFPSTFTLVGGEISGTIGVDGRLVDGRISGALQARDRARRLAQR